MYSDFTLRKIKNILEKKHKDVFWDYSKIKQKIITKDDVYHACRRTTQVRAATGRQREDETRGIMTPGLPTGTGPDTVVY